MAPAGPTSPAVKKRRRRAPATGAPEDCWNCQQSGGKCDRKRPYCGTCIDSEITCSGYKTQLTWGVGVASRGKLRGMTLPIARDEKVVEKEKAEKAAAAAEKAADKANGRKTKEKGTEAGVRKQSRSGSTGSIGAAHHHHHHSSASNPRGSSSPATAARLSIITNYDFVNMEPPSSAVTPSTGRSASSAAYSASSSRMPAIRLGQEHESPQSAITTPFSASSGQQYSRSPVPHNHGHGQSPHVAVKEEQHYRTSPGQYHKSPYSHVSLPPTQQHPPSMLLSPMSEYEQPSFSPAASQAQQYPMSSAPASAPLYDMVTGVSSSSSYEQPPSMQAPTTSGSPYSSMPAPMQPRHIHRSESWNGGQGVSSLHHHHHHQQHVTDGSGNLSALLYDEDMLGASTGPDSEDTVHPGNNEEGPRGSNSVRTFLIPPALSNLPSDIRFLIGYYDKLVCPSLVVFDGPTNPYRREILHLAFENSALLEAVCALALGHLQSKKRMGLPGQRGSGSPYDRRSNSPSIRRASTASSPSNAPLRSSFSPTEQTYSSTALAHKNNATALLTSQLGDPVLAKSDAAIGTLLILLLYHICETGVGNFKTHLAGVKKLMGMRAVGRESGRWGWMETVVTWLDNMCASLNNREAQLRGGYLDMIHQSSAVWGLESLTGCDRDLFMRLAGLGRINVLSQMPKTRASQAELAEAGDGEAGAAQLDQGDGRDEFWLAWNAMKRELVAFRPLGGRAPSSAALRALGSESEGDAAPKATAARAGPRERSARAKEAVEVNHWVHATNVYRFAAILYLDRLAYPHLHSSHPLFQHNVRKVLDHVACVPRSGYGSKLMWPLFITGTECVVDEHRELIRDRCLSMQKESGFFSKFVGLEVLEEVWKDDDQIEEMESRGNTREAEQIESTRSMGIAGLRWRTVTTSEDVEYLMV